MWATSIGPGKLQCSLLALCPVLEAKVSIAESGIKGAAKITCFACVPYCNQQEAHLMGIRFDGRKYTCIKKLNDTISKIIPVSTVPKPEKDF